MKTRALAMMGLMLVILAACGGSGGAGATGGGAGRGPGSRTPSGTDAGSNAADAGTGTGVQPYKLSGLTVDTKGAAIAGADLKVCNPLYFASCMHGATGADGRFSFDLPPGNVWEVEASIQKIFDGRNYCLDLKPDATAHFSSEAGAIRNFAWTISGLRPDAIDTKAYTAYYGGVAAVAVGDFNRPVTLDYVQLHFVPAGPVVDGSAAQAFSANAVDWAEFKIGNIPLAPYTVTAEYAQPGMAKSPLLVSPTPGATPASSATIHFDPDSPGVCVGWPTGWVNVYFP